MAASKQASGRTARHRGAQGVQGGSARGGSARDAIKQSRPFSSLGQEALINVLLTAEAVRWEITTVLAEHGDGLTQQQYNVLRILRGAGDEGLPTLEIAERMIERTPGITRMLDRLEAKGLVERMRSALDRRQVFCRLGRAGLELVEDLDPVVQELDERLFSCLPKKDQRELIRLLSVVRNKLAGPE